jgi:hypothetical protein
MSDARPTLSREHSTRAGVRPAPRELLPRRPGPRRRRGLGPRAPAAHGRCNARAHVAEDGSEVHHDAGEALSFCIALLNALGFDIPTRSHGSKSAAVTVTAPWGINVLGREDDEDEAEVDA